MEEINASHYQPVFLDVTKSPGRELAAFSTLFTSLFVINILTTYHYRSFLLSREQRGVLIGKWDRALVTLYILLVVLLEMEMVYGDRLTANGDWHGPSFMPLIAWICCNALSVSFVTVACFTRVRFRMFSYIPFCIHLMALGFIFLEIAVRSHFGFDILVPLAMFVVCLCIVFKVPTVFQIDERRFLYERERKKSGPSTEYSLVEEPDDLLDATILVSPSNGKEENTDDTSDIPDTTVKSD